MTKTHNYMTAGDVTPERRLALGAMVAAAIGVFDEGDVSYWMDVLSDPCAAIVIVRCDIETMIQAAKASKL
jgi:hypothetical protein